ncbi:unnamed protein product, partial [Iphiclides podalirius]
MEAVPTAGAQFGDCPGAHSINSGPCWSKKYAATSTFPVRKANRNGPELSEQRTARINWVTGTNFKRIKLLKLVGARTLPVYTHPLNIKIGALIVSGEKSNLLRRGKLAFPDVAPERDIKGGHGASSWLLRGVRYRVSDLHRPNKTPSGLPAVNYLNLDASAPQRPRKLAVYSRD